MKTVTLEQFKTFHPCWLETEEGRKRLEEIGSRKEEWTALDVLNLEDVSPGDRLLAVLREEFISAKILHEFACRCAERALTRAEITDHRCWNAIYAKRKWLRDEIKDKELTNANWCAAVAANSALQSAYEVYLDATLDGAWYAAFFASDESSVEAARESSWYAALNYSSKEFIWQIEELKKMLLEEKEREENEK